ncbi:unnamed protein product [Cylicocyclus nassatus]|uniref:acid phosphatase n=1 Tax=Cylicocyclus nassatus TaxID=53992 RepID=A0AA36H893_CYLNA|nr:unnamed protein product [Cylicocyclus nassatus]
MLPLLLIVTLRIGVQAIKDGEMELLLVQAMWRHGDRSPTRTYKNDPIREANWTFGGGGWGQLTPIGMRQMYNLGKSIRQKYIDSGFLSKQYSSKEIYIRSTDVNRTIISAMCNTMGMYGDTGNAGTDYPSDSNWLAGYTPIPVHTTFNDAGIHGRCKRRMQLWELAKASRELQDYKNSEDVSNLLEFLKEKSGETIGLDNVHDVRDPLYIEQIHFKEALKDVAPWFSDAVFDNITKLYDQTIRYRSGLFDSKIVVNGLDIGHELMRIRGGAFINELVTRMNHKFDCRDSNEAGCKWINGLKYYAYSVHDATVFQLFAIMGIERKVIIPGVFPEYSAAAFIELWYNKTDNQPYFKILYRANETSSIYPVTEKINECVGKEYCSLQVFRDFAEKVKLHKSVSELCDEDPIGEAGPISKSSFAKSSFQVSLSSTAVLLTWMML